MKSSCASKNTIKKLKRQTTEWETISANHISDIGLVFRVHKELLQLNDKNNHPIKTWTKDLNRWFSKEDTQMVNMQMKTCSTSLFFREMQIEIPMR